MFTLGVLAPYRELGIGHSIMDNLLAILRAYVTEVV